MTEAVEVINVAHPVLAAAIGMAQSLKADGWVITGATRGGVNTLWLVTLTRSGRVTANEPVRPFAEQAESMGLRLVAVEPDVIWSGVAEPRG